MLNEVNQSGNQQIPMNPQMQNHILNSYFELWTLIAQFWISGLFILSLIFTFSESQELNQMNLFIFIGYGVSSLIGGCLSDHFSQNRIYIFNTFSVILLVAALIMFFVSSVAGYIIAGVAIGPINNLTFVIIMQKFPSKKQIYTVYVLMGWAFSQITLGTIFLFLSNRMFYGILLGVTFLYVVAVFVFLDNSVSNNTESQASVQNVDDSVIKQSLINNDFNNRLSFIKQLLPYSYKHLAGGCIFMFVMQMFYYKTQFTLDTFGISLQVNTIVVGFTQLIANLIFSQIIHKVPRRIILRILILFLAALFCLLIAISSQIFQTVIEGVMRLATTANMITLGVYLPELFQVSERGKGINYVMSFGVLGSALNGVLFQNLPLWTLSIFLTIAFFSTFLLKQTYFPKKYQN